VTVVVATSVLSQDEPVAAWCAEHGVECFRGDEQDVLDRYLRCAEAYAFDQIVRLTADNPFTDIEELDRLIELHLEQGFDYTHSFGIMPQGVGAEIFTFPALQRSHVEGHEPHHREHVNEYMQEHPELFASGQLQVPASKINPDLRLTVDTEDDWQRACVLAAQAGDTWLNTENAIALCMLSA
jgi:spore coat polysaccharide biosynthesis protein SpsF